MSHYICPHCEKQIRKFSNGVPVTIQCGSCRRWIRLVGDRFMRWSDWQTLLVRIRMSLSL